MNDFISLKKFEVMTRIGVTEKEQEKPQRLLITVQAEVSCVSSAAKSDDITASVNYSDISNAITKLASERPRKLVETFAEEVATAVLELDHVISVTVEVEKFPGTRCVSVTIHRRKT